MKICTKCKVEKSLEDFHKNLSNKDGFQYQCKICRKGYGLTEQRKAYMEDYYINNKDIIINKSKNYYENNKDKIFNRLNLKYNTDINYKLSTLLRRRMSKLITRGQKAGSAIRDLGCSIDHLRLHLELFWDEGMTWDNYGLWVIDHIIPLSSFDLTDRNQMLDAVRFKNLQPLWYEDNQSKIKEDKIYISKKRNNLL